MKYEFKKMVRKAVQREMEKYVSDKAVPTTSKWIDRNCNKGYATGKLANSVYYDRNSKDPCVYTVYVEAFNREGTNYAKYADQGRGPVRPVYKPNLVYYYKNGARVVTQYAGPAAGAHFIRDTVKDLQH